MLYIIKDYRKLLEQNEKLKKYLKHLEKKLDRVAEKHAKDVATNRKICEILTKRNRENKRLKAHIEWLNEKFYGRQESFSVDYNNTSDDEEIPDLE